MAVNGSGSFRAILNGATNQWQIGHYSLVSSNATEIVLKVEVLTDLHSEYPTRDEDVAGGTMAWTRDGTLVYTFRDRNGVTESFRLEK